MWVYIYVLKFSITGYLHRGSPNWENLSNCKMSTLPLICLNRSEDHQHSVYVALFNLWVVFSLIGFSSSPVNINVHVGILQKSYCFVLSLNNLMHVVLKVCCLINLYFLTEILLNHSAQSNGTAKLKLFIQVKLQLRFTMIWTLFFSTEYVFVRKTVLCI